ncbi:hypothetical protein CGZ80_25060 [Rhodopirellula sp. MGV]|nr:hypothetical protein CGZ80_25060 [Rhodopirellula sp. MGV]PNY35825.1 hypothetical protein C2E31_16220 [Rhodopirellula baltica]
MEPPNTNVRSAFSESADDALTPIEEDCVVKIFVFGKRVYGIVDEVPGHFYVGTFFWHVYWLPLFPVESWIFVVGGDEVGRARSVPLPICLRSVVMAWLRIVLGVVSVSSGLLAIGGLVSIAQGDRQFVLITALLFTSAVSFLAFRVLMNSSCADINRAEHLAVLAGYSNLESISRIVSTNAHEFEELNRECTVPCQTCHRPVAPSCKVCPRCETRLR